MLVDKAFIVEIEGWLTFNQPVETITTFNFCLDWSFFTPYMLHSQHSEKKYMTSV